MPTNGFNELNIMQNHPQKSKCQNLTYLHEKLRKHGYKWGFRVPGEQISKSISSETKQNGIIGLLDYHQGMLGWGCRLY